MDYFCQEIGGKTQLDKNPKASRYGINFPCLSKHYQYQLICHQCHLLAKEYLTIIFFKYCCAVLYSLLYYLCVKREFAIDARPVKSLL